MIAGIDHQADIDLYLEAEEISRLPNSTIEGVLIKTRKPKRQGIITISINDARNFENGFGIGVYDKNYWGILDGFRVDVFMGTEIYQKFQKRGFIGLRQQMLDGSKIHIYDRLRLDGMGVSILEHLEFYRDNKDKLPDSFS